VEERAVCFVRLETILPHVIATCFYPTIANSMNRISTTMQSGLIGLALLAVLLTGCDTPTSINDTEDVAVTPSSPALTARLDEAALAVSEIVGDPTVVAAIAQGVQMHRLEGHDEQVPFAKLLGRNPQAKAYGKAGAPFAEAFRDALKRRGAQQTGAKSTAEDLEAYLVANDVVIYWPYAENFQGGDLTAPVVAPHPLDENAETVKAYRLSQAKGAKAYSYEELSVDESYASLYPVLIVAPGGEYGYPKTTQPPTGTTTPSGDVVRVSLGEVQCRENFDTWASGGPELDFIRLEVEPNGTTKGYEFADTKIEVRPSRKDCKYKRWLSVGTSWDSNWEARHKDQGFVVFDRDKFRETRVTFNLGYKGKIKGVNVDTKLNGSFKIGNNDVIYRNPLNRDSFLAFNRTNVDGLGTRSGFAVRGGGSGVRYTLRDAIYAKSGILAETGETAAQ